MILQCGAGLGSLVFAVYVQANSLNYPFVPTIALGLNALLWAINLWLGFVQNTFLLFLWMMVIGGLRQVSFINFLFLANAKTNLPCDLNLEIYDRELTVNLFLISYDIGMKDTVDV